MTVQVMSACSVLMAFHTGRLVSASAGISKRRRDGLRKVTLEDLDAGSAALALPDNFLFVALVHEIPAMLDFLTKNNFNNYFLQTGTNTRL